MPEQNGTKKYLAKYGDALVCVRYCYDEQKRKQFETVEIIVSESDWEPPAAKYPDSTLVGLAIGLKETSLQSQVKAVGGRWNKDKKLWIVPLRMHPRDKTGKVTSIRNQAIRLHPVNIYNNINIDQTPNLQRITSITNVVHL